MACERFSLAGAGFCGENVASSREDGSPRTMDFDTLRYYLRGRMFERLRRYDQAEREYRTALRFDPRSPKVTSALGYLLARQQRYEEALGYFEEAVRLNPKNAPLLFDLGFVREKLRRIGPAIEAFQAAVMLDPKLDRAWYGMGMCYAMLGRHEEAVGAFQQAAELQPMNPHAWYALGMAYHHTHKPDKVKEVVHHLFRFDPLMTRQLIRDAERADLAHLVKDLKV